MIEKKQVKINGFAQNCYATVSTARIGELPPQLKNHTMEKYYSLEEKKLPNGFTQGLVEKDYPINRDSVTSYVEASDYRNDPAGAIANAPKRVNLGDISGVQEFVNSNPMQAMQHYTEILKKVTSYLESQQKVQAEQPPVQPANDGGSGQ